MRILAARLRRATVLAYTGTYSNNTLTLDDGSGAPQVFRR